MSERLSVRQRMFMTRMRCSAEPPSSACTSTSIGGRYLCSSLVRHTNSRPAACSRDIAADDATKLFLFFGWGSVRVSVVG